MLNETNRIRLTTGKIHSHSIFQPSLFNTTMIVFMNTNLKDMIKIGLKAAQHILHVIAKFLPVIIHLNSVCMM